MRYFCGLGFQHIHGSASVLEYLIPGVSNISLRYVKLQNWNTFFIVAGDFADLSKVSKHKILYSSADPDFRTPEGKEGLKLLQELQLHIEDFKP